MPSCWKNLCQLGVTSCVPIRHKCTLAGAPGRQGRSLLAQLHLLPHPHPRRYLLSVRPSLQGCCLDVASAPAQRASLPVRSSLPLQTRGECSLRSLFQSSLQDRLQAHGSPRGSTSQGTCRRRQAPRNHEPSLRLSHPGNPQRLYSQFSRRHPCRLLRPCRLHPCR